METRKVRTPSARMLAAKQDEVAFEKVGTPIQSSTPATKQPAQSSTSTSSNTAMMSTLAAQLARVGAQATPTRGAPPTTRPVPTSSASTTVAATPVNVIRRSPSMEKVIVDATPTSEDVAPEEVVVEEEIVDVSNSSEASMDPRLQQQIQMHRHHQHHEEDVDEEVDPEEAMMVGDAIQAMKQEKMDAHLVLNGDFSVANEVTISSMKYQGRPSHGRKSQYSQDGFGTPQGRSSSSQRSGNFTGETLNLKSSDLSIPNKAAHFLYFRCYEEHEVQKEFPLTIDENRKGPQNFLVEPRVGLKNTDYYIDSYLWNRGKSTSSKKKIFVEIEGNHVKTSRRACESAHYVLNWYYSNMENRICKKVCWLETVGDSVRASPVLVQYHVNYLSDNPIELRKTPKLYSDTRSVAQELLRSDSPLQTVQRFVETGETDPREIINKKQAYEMRRYVMANARKRGLAARKYDEHGMYFDDDMFEEVYYNEHGEAINVRNSHRGGDSHSELNRIAQMAVRMEGRKIEHRIARMLDGRIGVPKNHTELVSEWINTLEATTADDYDLVIHQVVGSMRKHIDDLLGENPTDYLVPSTSDEGIKRMKMMVGEEEVDDEEDVVHDLHHRLTGGQGDRRRNQQKTRFEGERYIFDGQEYVEEEVIAEEIEEVVVEEVHPEESDTIPNGVGGPSTSNSEGGVARGGARVGGGASEDPFFYRNPTQGGGASSSANGSGGGGGKVEEPDTVEEQQ